jgi:hypothetical protein
MPVACNHTLSIPIRPSAINHAMDKLCTSHVPEMPPESTVQFGPNLREEVPDRIQQDITQALP